MSETKLIPVKEEFNDLENTKLLLVDLEGTLTPGESQVPRDPEPRHVYSVFEEDDFEIKTDLGYWSGLNLLAGERPKEYFKRVDRWRNGQTTREEFEEENIRLMNKLLDRSDHDTAEELIEWYNEEFLNLREKSYELVKNFKEAGYSVGIISHTSESLCLKAAEDLGADFVVPTWNFETEDGRFKYISKTVYADDKSEILDELHDSGFEDVVFIGNGANDIEIAEKNENSFMIENKEEVRYHDLDAETGSFEEVFEKVKDQVSQ